MPAAARAVSWPSLRRHMQDNGVIGRMGHNVVEGTRRGTKVSAGQREEFQFFLKTDDARLNKLSYLD